jgi:hypothetical protein
MTLALREKADLFDRIQRQFRRAERHRERIAFQAALDEIARRGPPVPAPPPPPPAPTARQVDAEERARFDQAMRDLLVRVHARPVPDRTRQDDGAWWSNERVAGYRVWSISQGGLWGAKTRWDSPTKSAVCLKGHGATGTIPHLEAECGEPACGIYALKDPDAAWARAWHQMTQVTTAIGMVEMEGRVIEHSHGYRAERATITRLCVIARLPTREVRLALLDEAGDIERLCRAPATVAMPLSRPDLGEALEMARAWL